MGAWTKLQAVNRILRDGGEHPVNTLASTSGDSMMAEATLDEVTYEHQVQGLACNTEELTLEPDSSGKIAVPENALHVQSLACSDVHDLGSNTGVTDFNDDMIVERGGFLYNVPNNTDIFTDAVRVRVVLALAFEDLPYAQQLAITTEASRRYQMQNQGSPQQDAMLREINFIARAKSRAQNIRSRSAGIFGRWGSSRPYYGAKRTRRW